ncbi:MAG: hypothetical protein ABII07_00475 [Patescibacteria group bacterium]|nr:hypothetical protein [Patescibacteria group bacterium]
MLETQRNLAPPRIVFTDEQFTMLKDAFRFNCVEEFLDFLGIEEVLQREEVLRLLAISGAWLQEDIAWQIIKFALYSEIKLETEEDFIYVMQRCNA